MDKFFETIITSFIKDKSTSIPKILTCFYCMKKENSSNKCRIKHFGIPNKKYARILKDK